MIEPSCVLNIGDFEEFRQLLLLRSDGINQQNCTVPSYTDLGLVGPVIVFMCAVFFVEVSSPIFFSTFLVYDRTELCVEYWGEKPQGTCSKVLLNNGQPTFTHVLGFVC
jgi:hypothetical protein